MKRVAVLAAAAALVALVLVAARATRAAVHAELMPPVGCCPLGVCDGSGLLTTIDITGRDTDLCPCMKARPPRVPAWLVRRTRATILAELDRLSRLGGC